MPLIQATEEVFNFINDMLGKDDPKCRFRLNQKVRKINPVEGDIHLEGDTGIIKGSFRMEADGLPKVDCYLVQWDNDAEGINIFLADQDDNKRLEAAT